MGKSFDNWLKRRQHRSRVNALKVYGLTQGKYDVMLEAQGGVCDICHLPQTGKTKYLAVDHDHSTGKVRSLLCRSCNVMLGCAQDSPDRLRAAAAYLLKHGK